MSSSYNSDAIEVLTGLEPVRKRPGMYTQTERPNHLAQEVIDNSVDEAIAGLKMVQSRSKMMAVVCQLISIHNKNYLV